MDKYIDMRVFSFENGGKSSTKVKEEYEKRYNSVSTIRLPFKINNLNAFVVLNGEMVNSISLIYQHNTKLMSELESVPREAYREYVIQSLIDEIQQSNEFENVESTRQEIKKAYDNIEKKNYRFNGMVNKYNMLLSDTNISLLTSSDVRKLYDEFILDEVIKENPEDGPDGEIFRKDVVHIYGKSMESIHDGLYPESRIIETMDQALHVLNDDDIELLIRVAIFHFMIGYIHPFYNGNGRISRFISSYMLSKSIDLSVCLRISYIIKENRSLYQRIFKEAEDNRNMGDITGFVNSFLILIKTACIDVENDIHEKNTTYKVMKRKLDEKLQNKKIDIAPKYKKVFYFILEKTIFIGNGATIEDISKNTGVAKMTLNKLFEKASDFVYKKKDGRKNRWFIRFQL